ncbi:MAG: BMC domain-containing protein [Chloroflexi bacterium]|nr:MAG: BMC domain-containing protein [Chloroflexota bacterium]
MNEPALALLEFDSIAAGIEAGDAMVKRSPVARIQTGTVQPGHYLVMVTGDVATVEEAVKAGKEIGHAALRDEIFLPNVHPDVVTGLGGMRQPVIGDALGIVETRTVAAAIYAADAGLKGAEVALLQLRLADGLGGKGLALFTGLVADVEAAVDIGSAVSGEQLIRQVVIAQLHNEMWPNVDTNGRFGEHFNWRFM